MRLFKKEHVVLRELVDYIYRTPLHDIWIGGLPEEVRLALAGLWQEELDVESDSPSRPFGGLLTLTLMRYPEIANGFSVAWTDAEFAIWMTMLRTEVFLYEALQHRFVARVDGNPEYRDSLSALLTAWTAYQAGTCRDWQAMARRLDRAEYVVRRDVDPYDFMRSITERVHV